MLELTARHADAWNLAWFGLPDERLARVRGELMDACARVGRDPSTLGITVGVTVRYPDHAVAAEDAEDDPPPKALVGTPEEIAEGLAAHAAEGTDHVIAALDPCTPETVALFAQAVERFRGRARGLTARSTSADSGRCEPPRLEAFDPSPRQPRSVARRLEPAELEQPDDASALPAVRLEQLEHPRVGPARLARQRERHEVGQMEVADADRVLVTERPNRRLRRRSTVRSPARTAAGRTHPRVACRRSPRTTPPLTRRRRIRSARRCSTPNGWYAK